MKIPWKKLTLQMPPQSLIMMIIVILILKEHGSYDNVQIKWLSDKFTYG